VTPLSVAIEHDTRLSRPAAGAPLTLRGVRRSFGAKTVLDGVDLHVPAGQFLIVVGRSGCGKSTLLRLIAGLDEPTAGKTHDVAEAVALGDRIVLIDHGAIAADIPVDLTRPRQRGSVEFARVEAELLERLLAAAD
jgi:sulfonate transport system ATP-binding protein